MISAHVKTTGDAILFSVNPKWVNVERDAIGHLKNHKELYWEVMFRIRTEDLPFPLYGYMHISGAQVEYRATISRIIPFSRAHYENKDLAAQVKPAKWLDEWRDSHNDLRTWNNVLVITEIVPFERDTLSFEKISGGTVKKAPQNYIRVRSPD